jgi:hypothetical protein
MGGCAASVAMLCRRPVHVREYEIAGVRDERGASRKGGHMTNEGAHPQSPAPSTLAQSRAARASCPRHLLTLLLR